ncbi:MAG: P-loop NTPase [Desulfurococcaceae archaeon]|nr:P-loop NTPase [Sulfolobales archaeon]MDW8170479.1 P-loop NTPase [Desulfurococcaceae archaeon]
MDPRLLIISKRMEGVKAVVPVMSPKGGVGKTLIASSLALAFAERGRRVGLLDLDVTNASSHIVLGVRLSELKPIEEKGLVPPLVNGVKFMTIGYYSCGNPLPLRGGDIDEVIKEMLATVIWSQLDLLLIDTPPGISDEVLDVISYVSEPRPLIVTTSSKLSIASIEKLLKILTESRVKAIGVVENMVVSEESAIKDLVDRYGVEVIGRIPYDPFIERSIGDVRILKSTSFFSKVMNLADKVLMRLSL